MNKRAAIATLSQLEGYRVTKELGRVAVRIARPRNRLRDVVSNMRLFLGVIAFEILTDDERARRQSVLALQDDAERLGADAVIGVRFRIGKMRDGSTHVMALGRAVLLDPPLISKPKVKGEA